MAQAPERRRQGFVVFLGEPYLREVCIVEGKYMPFDDALKAQGLKPTLRIALNVALFGTKEMKALEQGVTFFKDLVRVRDKYTLEKWAFEVQRHGAAKDPKTTYSVLPEHQLTPEQIRAFNALQQRDLPKLYESTPAEEQAPAADGLHGGGSYGIRATSPLPDPGARARAHAHRRGRSRNRDRARHGRRQDDHRGADHPGGDLPMAVRSLPCSFES